MVMLHGSVQDTSPPGARPLEKGTLVWYKDNEATVDGVHHEEQSYTSASSLTYVHNVRSHRAPSHECVCVWCGIAVRRMDQTLVNVEWTSTKIKVRHPEPASNGSSSAGFTFHNQLRQLLKSHPTVGRKSMQQ